MKLGLIRDGEFLIGSSWTDEKDGEEGARKRLEDLELFWRRHKYHTSRFEIKPVRTWTNEEGSGWELAN